MEHRQDNPERIILCAERKLKITLLILFMELIMKQTGRLIIDKEQQTLTGRAVVGSETDAIKERFKEGSIPLQTDFEKLIDIANIGRQAVGDEERGWGLAKDSQNRLQFEPSKIFNLNYDLSPNKTNQQVSMHEFFSGEKPIHKKVAFLAFREDIGPTQATNTRSGNSTVYTIDAVKIDSAGVRTYTKVNIIADKSIGKGNALLPFEYIENTSTTYSLWYKFMLDTTTEDFSNCTLVITPLTLAINYIKDISNDTIGENISLMNVNFVYHGVIIGDGLQVDNVKITAKVDASKGLTVDSNGISVKTGNGTAFYNGGVSLKLAKGTNNNGGGGHGADGETSGNAGGLALSSNGLSVYAGSGMQINAQGVSVKLATNSGLSVDVANGLKIIPEQTFQKGMILMFSGTIAPTGWALCDGSNGTPNLINRFILGSTLTDSAKYYNSAPLTGSGNTRAYKKPSTLEMVSGSVNVDDTTLAPNQVPSHDHIGGMAYNNSTGFRYSSDSSPTASFKIENREGSHFQSYNGSGGRPIFTTDSKHNPVYAKTSNTGGGGGHNHTARMSTTAHQHTTDVIPPYYTLAFIIKL
jgi:microcystin-dependent protein